MKKASVLKVWEGVLQALASAGSMFCKIEVNASSALLCAPCMHLATSGLCQLVPRPCHSVLRYTKREHHDTVMRVQCAAGVVYPHQ